jgi:pimeloyl-ACP methyl ester carboxylesterase
MFQSIVRSSEGFMRSFDPLIVAGDHATAPARNRVKRQAIRQAGEWMADAWPEDFHQGALFERVASEALNSDLISGETPQAWSPAGALRPESGGSWRTTEDFLTAITGEPAPITFDTLLPNASPVLTLREGGTRPTAALALMGDSFVLPVPAGTDWVEVDTRPETPAQVVEHRAIEIGLKELVDAPMETALLWRLYSGDNTIVLDGVSEGRGGWRRVTLGGTRKSGFLVGRLVMTVHRRTGGAKADPTAQRRRVRRELAQPHLARGCPDVRLVWNRVPSVAVAVHGTMASAMPLAEEMRNAIRPGIPVVRFEHDTWAPIATNAEDLARELRRIGAQHLLLVGHSRGGLVARHTAVELARVGVATELVTLGTPYRGTPIVGAVRGGLIGTRVLLGALRTAAGGVIVDPTTRLLGLLLRDMPRGLADMEPDSGYLRGAALTSLRAGMRVAGKVDPAGIRDSYGIQFLGGLAHPAFGSEPNDLVVSADSASDAVSDNTATIYECDHFSYLVESSVTGTIGRLGDQLPGGMHQVEAEEPTWLRTRSGRAGEEPAGDELRW